METIFGFVGLHWSVKLSKNMKSYEVRIFLLSRDLRTLKDDGKLSEGAASLLSEEVLGGAHVDVHLCDDRFNIIPVVKH